VSGLTLAPRKKTTVWKLVAVVLHPVENFATEPYSPAQ
jgi:hypothetical protein